MSKVALISQIFIFVSVWSVPSQTTRVYICSCQRQSMLRAGQSETNTECSDSPPQKYGQRAKMYESNHSNLYETFLNTGAEAFWKEKSLDMWVKINAWFQNSHTEILRWGKWPRLQLMSLLISNTWVTFEDMRNTSGSFPAGSWLPVRPFPLLFQQSQLPFQGLRLSARPSCGIGGSVTVCRGTAFARSAFE